MNNKSLENKISNIKIYKKDSILLAIKKMDKSATKLLLVFDENIFFSLLSIGDIQRAILNNIDLNTELSKILRSQLTYSYDYENLDEIKKKMLKDKIECMPILDKNEQLVDIYFWKDFFGSKQKINKISSNLPVIIMAGGKGARLQPLTNVIPKPLIPINDKTIIENIMDTFVSAGCNNFFLSINYKADLIKHFFSNPDLDNYKIHFFEEEKPLGTAGSLSLIRDKIKTSFFVSNCDILINQDYNEIYEYHSKNRNELTMVSALSNISIPYGIIETTNNGLLKNIKEKPELIFQINAGLYILEPHLLKEIPKNKFFHITDLILSIQERGGRVGVFPVSEGSWSDIGEWSKYIKKINK